MIKMFSMRYLRSSLLVLAVAVFSLSSVAQIQPNTDPGCIPDCDPLNPIYNCSNPACQLCPVCIPIDGGLGFLIAAGIGLGARRSLRRRVSAK